MQIQGPHSAALPDREAKVYRNAVSRNFSFLKRTDRFDLLLVKSLALPSPSQGCLVPVADLHADDERLIEKLAGWRKENYFAYPTQFPVTLEGTRSWLRSRLLEVEDRILFLVLDQHGIEVGHLGFNDALSDSGLMEVDNVVRGVKPGNSGIMGAALNTLLKWAREVIGCRGFFLRVFEDNSHATAFYRRLGFVDDLRIPLRKKTEGQTTSFVPLAGGDTAPPDKTFLRMVHVPDSKNVAKSLILTAGPSISAREAAYSWDAAKHGWNHGWNHYLSKFEQTFAEYVGMKHAIATSSCTGALHLSLAALGIGPGDEVIVPDITWVATANAVLYVGATPIFADIEADSWCLDPASFESKITERTKAVIPVHLYGHPARMDQIMAIAHKHNLFVVEDAAPAIGAEFNGQKTGTFGHFAAFSFQGAKLLVTGEGGILLTNDTALYKKAHTLWDQGRNPNKTFWIDERGWKYKMSNIQAALGLAQIERCDELVEMKRRLFSWYAEGLHHVPHLRLNREIPGARSIYWMSSILLDEKARISRDDLRAELKKRNVDTRPVFPAISQYPIWPTVQAPLPMARFVGNQAINLPSGVCLEQRQIDYICKSIKELL